MDCVATLPRITGCHRFIDQSRNLTAHLLTATACRRAVVVATLARCAARRRTSGCGTDLSRDTVATLLRRTARGDSTARRAAGIGSAVSLIAHSVGCAGPRDLRFATPFTAVRFPAEQTSLDLGTHSTAQNYGSQNFVSHRETSSFRIANGSPPVGIHRHRRVLLKAIDSVENAA